MIARAPRWHEVTAIFGGTFDPPHVGHLEAVKGLFHTPGVKNVIILPTASPPHKPSFAASGHRARMAELCFTDPSLDIRFDTRELERSRLHADSPSYTYNTLLELRREIPSLAFVIGADQLASFPTWYRFPEVLELAHWIVLERKEAPSVSSDAANTTLKLAEKGPTFMKIVPTNARALSSTRIREEIARTGHPPANSLTTEVIEYIRKNRLYGADSTSR